MIISETDISDNCHKANTEAGFCSLITAKNIVMSDIDQGNKRFPFIKPDYTDIHIDTEFKQVIGPLQAFYPKRRMQRIFGKEQEL